MFPFWETVIHPILEAVAAKRVIEIGALRGETTALMLEVLGPDAELHVIDPTPDFDPEEHRRAFPGPYFFYEALSLEVLPTLPPVDVALIDGDHNWYTVYNELRSIEETSITSGEPFPVLIIHDVGWPYGRRDLYYAPERIPEEFRQPYATRGIRPGKSDLATRHGGLNPTMNNATTESGPRNGVMTAVEDYIDESALDLDMMVIPIYFGLAIVVEKHRLANEPALAETLARLESVDGQRDLLELAEETRIRAMVFQHNVLHHRERLLDEAGARYLRLLKGSLLDTHYLENELRIKHLVKCIEDGKKPNTDVLRDPARWMRDKARRLLAARQAGHLSPDDGADDPSYFPFTTMGRVRLDHFESVLDSVRDESISGDLVECGTGRGGGAIFMRGYLDAYSMDGRRVWVADRFSASIDDPEASAAAEAPAVATRPSPLVQSTDEGGGATIPVPGRGPDYLQFGADLNAVRDAFHRFDLLDDRVRFLQGDLDHTLPDAGIDEVALLRLGAGIGVGAASALEQLYGKVTDGGFVVIDEYVDDGCRAAVDAFRASLGLDEELDRVDWSGRFWRRDIGAERGDLVPARVEPSVVEHRSLPARAPLASLAGKQRKALTVAVVFYNMRREAARTLHSLTRAYQRDIDDLDYEVIAVENGSDAEQLLGEGYVESFGPEFSYLNLGRDAHPSPAHALNLAIQAGNGDAYALMIDGAHVLTPGVLHYGMAGMRTYHDAVVSTQQWYMGPAQQGDAMADGYDQDYEDRLFEQIDWPIDGYRLFDIGQFIGERDWLDGMWESNCLFVPRRLLAQLGGFDESFDLPGGEYANLDLYERLASSPDTAFATILGEGSFHQVHGGTTTNQPETDLRRQRISSYAEHYRQLRGRGFKGHQRPIHYVGHMFAEANRTRARRRIAPVDFNVAGSADPDGRPESPAPLPQELQTEFIDAFWRTLRWKRTTWLGHSIPKAPTDLFVYQELLASVEPEWIIETTSGSGGRALFLATICDLLGRGQVLSIGAKNIEALPRHARIVYEPGACFGDDVRERTRTVVGDIPNSLVILGSRARRQRTVKEFETFEPFIPPGSYAIVEETIVNGHPVWASFGPGPAEAVKQILTANPDFVSDLSAEKYGLTFNAGGFLKRLPRA